MVKTVSFAAVHFSVAFAVVWAMTGDWRVGGLTALIEPCINTVAYHFHEKVWKGRDKGQSLNKMVMSEDKLSVYSA
ncbi:MAG: DUF2061 domain-containing protein [Alcanivorax sediminis]|uniref:DUF2061 domain-containing protein n=1 Tax=Alcanivorax sediminis TaxID=2663008 RepID=A0A6N7M3V8_9GAMM|nr:DUF2061 domain-containing protein [Alcanivorax sediminis]MQX54860.1 DUF2061 domain-containing protein [Alcanivorax sediminis]